MTKYCSFCGAEVAMHVECDTGCPNCIAIHQSEMDAGLIPAGLPREGYKFWLWKRIRQRERDVNAGRMSEEEARADVESAVESAKRDYELNVSRIAEERREAEALKNERGGPTGFLL